MKNQYAVITGASQGLGKFIAIEFAKKGINLVLISYPGSGQKKVVNFIGSFFNVKVFNLEYDLSIYKNYEKISSFIVSKEIEIKYIVNNAGVLSRGLFENLDQNYILSQIQVNVTAPTLLIKLFLANLKRNSPSGILNISSMAGFFAIPKKQVYGATKSYLLSFSESLRKELKQYNITVSTVCPGGLNTTTRLCYQNKKVNWLMRNSVLNPETAAKISVAQFFKRKNIIIPGFINKILMIIDVIIPSLIKEKLTMKEMNKLERLSMV